jgi:hypothetical protein
VPPHPLSLRRVVLRRRRRSAAAVPRWSAPVRRRRREATPQAATVTGRGWPSARPLLGQQSSRPMVDTRPRPQFGPGARFNFILFLSPKWILSSANLPDFVQILIEVKKIQS